MAALDVVDAFATDLVWTSRSGQTTVAPFHHLITKEPVAAIHVAGASVGWLYGAPSAVTDPEAVHRKLAETANDFAPMV